MLLGVGYFIVKLHQGKVLNSKNIAIQAIRLASMIFSLMAAPHEALAKNLRDNGENPYRVIKSLLMTQMYNKITYNQL